MRSTRASTSRYDVVVVDTTSSKPADSAEEIYRALVDRGFRPRWRAGVDVVTFGALGSVRSLLAPPVPHGFSCVQ
jgi:hypothetical protein